MWILGKNGVIQLQFNLMKTSHWPYLFIIYTWNHWDKLCEQVLFMWVKVLTSIWAFWGKRVLIFEFKMGDNLKMFYIYLPVKGWAVQHGSVDRTYIVCHITLHIFLKLLKFILNNAHIPFNLCLVLTNYMVCKIVKLINFSRT